MSIRTEFVTFVVKEGLEAEADRWMRLLVQRQQECLETLEQERMHYESVFRSIRGGRLCLSWFSVQSSGGRDVRDSSHEIDRLHLEFWNKCMDPNIPPERLEHIVSFVSEDIADVISKRDAASP